MTLPGRFWSKVNKAGPEARPGLGPCWLWTAAIKRGGYGQCWWQGSMREAHRLALGEKLGRPVPVGMDTLHECDVRACVNPTHLREGTRGDNNRDRHAKGRTVLPGCRGEEHGNARLTWFGVSVIRASRGTDKQLAEIFGVSQGTVNDVRRNRTWVGVLAECAAP